MSTSICSSIEKGCVTIDFGCRFYVVPFNILTSLNVFFHDNETQKHSPHIIMVYLYMNHVHRTATSIIMKVIPVILVLVISRMRFVLTNCESMLAKMQMVNCPIWQHCLHVLCLTSAWTNQTNWKRSRYGT